MAKQSRLIMYVDGFNLYHGLHDKYRHRYLWLDLVALAKNLRPMSELIAVKYFTAQVMNEPAAQARQNVYLDALEELYSDKIEIVQGRYQAKQRYCRSCQASWTVYEEKETDVNIAVSIVADAAANTADMLLVVSGDSDLAPAVRMSTILNPNIFIAAAFPPGRYSAELKNLMPASFHIGRAKVAGSLLPDSIVAGDGTSVLHRRPNKWK